MFSENLKKLREQNEISQVRFAKEIGFSQAAVSAWENNTREPGIAALLKIAQYFNISVDYLVQNKKSRSQAKGPPSNLSTTLPSDEKELLDLYRQLSYEGKQRLIARAEVMVEDKERKKYQA